MSQKITARGPRQNAEFTSPTQTPTVRRSSAPTMTSTSVEHFCDCTIASGAIGGPMACSSHRWEFEAWPFGNEIRPSNRSLCDVRQLGLFPVARQFTRKGPPPISAVQQFVHHEFVVEIFSASRQARDSLPSPAISPNAGIVVFSVVFRYRPARFAAAIFRSSSFFLFFGVAAGLFLRGPLVLDRFPFELRFQ